jgi:hypothetical protein
MPCISGKRGRKKRRRIRRWVVSLYVYVCGVYGVCVVCVCGVCGVYGVCVVCVCGVCVWCVCLCLVCVCACVCVVCVCGVCV